MSLNAYCGAIESELAHRGVSMCRTSYVENATVPLHEHPHAYICINVAGNFQECSGRKEYEVRTHDLVYHPPGHRHADRFSKNGGHCLNLEMAPGSSPSFSWGSPGAKPIYANDPEMRRLGRGLIQESRRPEAGAASLAVEELLFTLFARLRGPARRRGDRPPHWLLEVRDRLRSTCTETHRLEALAETAGVHPVHLAREFRRQFGCPVHVYLLRCRVETAAHELANGNRPLADVALELGFCSQSHFSRAFWAATGTTPGAYRSRARGTNANFVKDRATLL